MPFSIEKVLFYFYGQVDKKAMVNYGSNRLSLQESRKSQEEVLGDKVIAIKTFESAGETEIYKSLLQRLCHPTCFFTWN